MGWWCANISGSVLNGLPLGYMAKKGQKRHFPEKGTKTYSVLKGKCPRCQEGDLFITSNPYHSGEMMRMHTNCPVCGEDFRRETGFYSAALWTSYPITLLLALACIVLLLFVFHLSMLPFFVLFSLIMLLLQPFIMRWGRAILLNMFVDFDPQHNK
jgi:uncharacterized protein (DUF983 family)